MNPPVQSEFIFWIDELIIVNFENLLMMRCPFNSEMTEFDMEILVSKDDLINIEPFIKLFLSTVEFSKDNLLAISSIPYFVTYKSDIVELFI